MDDWGFLGIVRWGGFILWVWSNWLRGGFLDMRLDWELMDDYNHGG